MPVLGALESGDVEWNCSKITLRKEEGEAGKTEEGKEGGGKGEG